MQFLVFFVLFGNFFPTEVSSNVLYIIKYVFKGNKQIIKKDMPYKCMSVLSIGTLLTYVIESYKLF